MTSKAEMLKLYREMLFIRRVEERIADRYDEDQMKCPTHLSTGQEAVAVGICAHLTDADIVYSTHRCHAHYLAKGGDLNAMIAEMYGKETGCAKGRSGSMHLIDVDRGMYGASAIVCGSIPLAVGAALSFKLRGEPRVAVAFFGDAAVEPGVFHECMNFAQFNKLPMIFVCENNDYSTMTLRSQRQCVPIAPRAEGYGMRYEAVDGNDIFRVHSIAEEAVSDARSGLGPWFIEAETYRWREHVEHNKGIMARSAEEVESWKAKCPISRLKRLVLKAGVTSAELDLMEEEIRTKIDVAFTFAEESPSPDPAHILQNVGDELPTVSPSDCKPAGDRYITGAEAIAEATVQAMELDSSVFVMGLHVEDPNGIFGTTVQAAKQFGHSRVMETPISEGALTGIAGGAAIMGMHPLHIHARNDFLLLGLSQLGNELTKWCYMSAGKLRVPIVIRAIVGRSRGQGCQHSQSLQSLFAHFPGLHLVAPSNAYDAKGLLMTALAGKTPVIMMEHRLCHSLKGAVPEEPYHIPFGVARVCRSGSDITVVSVLHMVHEAEHAAAFLSEHDIGMEVIDLRTIRPWDQETVCRSVQKTGRLIVADTGWVDFGISAEVVSKVTERCFSDLKDAPVRIGLPPGPTPMAEPMENAYYPGWQEIAASAFRMMGRELPPDLSERVVHQTIQGPF